MKRSLFLFTLSLLVLKPCVRAQEPEKKAEIPVQVGNAFPNITTIAEYEAPTEAGIGALLPWANRLWFVSYVAHKRGEGTWLSWVDEMMRMHKHPASVVGTYTHRYIHTPTNLAFLGPHVIDTRGNVRTIDALKSYRLTSTMDHLTDPQNKVYMLAMEGEFFETVNNEQVRGWRRRDSDF